MDIVYYITSGWFCCILASSLVGWLRGHLVEGFAFGIVFGPLGILFSLKELPESKIEKGHRRFWRRWRASMTWNRIAIAATFAAIFVLLPYFRIAIQRSPLANFYMLFWMGSFYGVWFTLFRPASTPLLLFPKDPICPECDYNLTGNTTGRCPECGLEFGELDALVSKWYRED